MGISEKLPTERWRRLGILNVSLLCSCGLILLIALLVVLVVQPGLTVTGPRFLFHGDCSTSSTVDSVLHFIINIFSTCVLASSNFFMQIVSSPTRNEIAHAHQSLHSLEIGVSSLKNLGSLSWFKILIWAGLFISSIPIHILFNSTIYSTTYEGSDWYLTISTQAFVNQTIDYFVPGASLAAAGSSCPAAPEGTHLACDYSNTSFNTGSGFGSTTIPMGSLGYGVGANIQNASWNESLSRKSITKAAHNASSWDLLTPSDCFDEYRFCEPRKRYRDLVVVVDDVPGWTRSEVYNFNGNEAGNLSKFWDPLVPPNSVNSLWFSAACRLWRGREELVNNESPRVCGSSSDIARVTGCSGALGEPSGLDWINTTKLQGSWEINFRPSSMSIPPPFGYDQKFNKLGVKHCMAEPNPEYVCKVGLAPPLLFIVIGCVFIKGALCTAILYGLTSTSLVTPGDAISSFISQPDPNTAGLATMGLEDADRLEYESILDITSSDLSNGPRARKWRSRSRRFKSVLSPSMWVRTYTVLAGGMAFIAIGVGSTAMGYGTATLTGAFGKSATTNIMISFSYLEALLTVNMPQIILSFCYFAFNSFLTRIQVEEEWNSFSRLYRPLRVSDPKGEQVSNYRLQLPYKYSIPLIIISIVLHWILSNAIFLKIIEGGFWADEYQDKSIATGFGASDSSYVAVGVSGSAMLAILVISTVLCISVALFSFRKVSGDMVSGGTNSLVLSAACHVPVITRRNNSLSTVLSGISSQDNITERSTNPDASSQSECQRETSIQGTEMDREGLQLLHESSASHEAECASSVEEQQGLNMEEMRRLSGDMAGDNEMVMLEEVARSKIRWGAMSANPDILDSLDTDEAVLHLGFGTEYHKVEPPCEGRLYI